MPIPPMLASPATLPPFDPFPAGEPADPAGRSPYRVTFQEFVERFATSAFRCEILRGLIVFRREMRRHPFNARFQWLCGSFVENPGREPGDVDVVTFYDLNDADFQAIEANPALASEMDALADSQECKRRFHCDAYMVNLAADGRGLVSDTHYWYGLFSHQRVSFHWKGLIEVEVDSPDDDSAAEAFLASVTVP